MELTKDLPKGTELWLTVEHEPFQVGQRVYVHKGMAMGDKVMLMVSAEPDSRACGVPSTKLTGTPPNVAAVLPDEPEAAEDEASKYAGPVLDFLGAVLDVENDDLSQSFVIAYIDEAGPDDLGTLTTLMEMHNIPVGEKWTTPQLAAVYSGVCEMFQQEVPAAVTVILNPPAAAPPPPPTPAASAPEPEKKGPGRPKKDPNAPTVTTPATSVNVTNQERVKPRLGRNYTANEIDAAKLAAAMIETLLEVPTPELGNVIALAQKMALAALAVKEPKPA